MKSMACGVSQAKERLEPCNISPAQVSLSALHLEANGLTLTTRYSHGNNLPTPLPFLIFSDKSVTRAVEPFALIAFP